MCEQNSGLELSRELCELEQLQQERKAWAMDYYPSTTEGRLLRFVSRSNSSTSAKSASSSHSHTSYGSNPTPAPPTGPPNLAKINDPVFRCGCHIQLKRETFYNIAASDVEVGLLVPSCW